MGFLSNSKLNKVIVWANEGDVGWIWVIWQQKEFTYLLPQGNSLSKLIINQDFGAIYGFTCRFVLFFEG